MFSAKDIFLTKAKGGYTIAKSLRFRSSASAYLSRTNVATPTNNKIFTVSKWVKRGTINDATSFENLLGGTATQSDTFGFGSVTNNAGDSIQLRDASVGSYNLLTTQVFRDPSAWYHLVLSIDTTQATAANRVKLYVNGVQVTSFSTATYPAQNYVFEWNAASTATVIARRNSVSATYLFDGYLSEAYFIDGQALDPTYFGQTDTATGVWMPKAYTGSYGTNGFYLKFADASAATAAAIGKDSSPNGNNWTPNNISVTAGVTYDSMVDTPTNYDNGGNGAGNYAVLNPLAVSSNAATMSNANLSFSPSPATNTRRQGTIAVSTGKWYFEVSPTTLGGNFPAIGVMLATTNDFNNYVGAEAGTFGYYSSGGVNGGGGGRTYSSYTTTDIIGVAIDCDNSQITFYKNNSNAVTSGTTYESLTAGASYIPAASGYNSAVFVFNFGQRGFDNSTVWATLKASGFKALCTQNLPTPTIGATSSTNAANYMAVTTWSGNSGTQNISNAVNGYSFQPDFIWSKCRNSARSHRLIDAVRGASKQLYSDYVAVSEATPTSITAFLSNGFTTYNDPTDAYNVTGETYVSWQWKGGNGTSNIAVNAYGSTPSIASAVSANVTAGFSVVTYTGNLTAGATIGHGLGVAPKMVIVKDRDTAATDWAVYHASIGNTGAVRLNLTNATDTAVQYWNNTSPTSTVFSVGAGGFTNGSGKKIVAYCFAEVAGYSKFGSYTGNGSTDGPFVYCGFRPRFIMLKCSGAAENWQIYDTARDTYNVVGLQLLPNSSAAEAASSVLDVLSNGFKLRNSAAGGNQAQTYIYAAFAESPFSVNNRAR